jgi:hypothetical protein
MSTIAKSCSLRLTPPITPTASPKSTCASPRGCASGTNTSRDRRFFSRTQSVTMVMPPVNPCSSRSR